MKTNISELLKNTANALGDNDCMLAYIIHDNGDMNIEAFFTRKGENSDLVPAIAGTILSGLQSNNADDNHNAADEYLVLENVLISCILENKSLEEIFMKHLWEARNNRAIMVPNQNTPQA